MEQAVADGVGKVGVADAGVPVSGGQLAGDEGGGAFAAVFDDLDQVSSFGVAKGSQQPVVDGEQVEPRQAVEEPGEGSVTTADGELLQQAWQA